MSGRIFVCPSCRTVFDIPKTEMAPSFTRDWMPEAPGSSRHVLRWLGICGLVLAPFAIVIFVTPSARSPLSVNTTPAPEPSRYSREDIEAAWRDPEFQGLPIAKRIAIMSEMDPAFAAMNDGDKRYATEVTHGVSRPPILSAERDLTAPKTPQRIPSSALPEADDPLPPNGAILAGEVDPSSKHQLTVSNRTGRHAVVILRSVGMSTSALEFFVHANQDVFIAGVPDGNYRLIYLFGEGWNQEKGRFRRSAGAWEFDSPSAFWRTTSVTGETRRTEFDVIKITLHTVPNGNATTHKIDEDELLR